MPEKSGRLILRPHHTLCLQFFAGRGYSGEFVQNMFHIRQMLVEKPERIVLLHSGTDDICAACPNNRSSRCKTQQKVARYDEKCRRACDFSPEQLLPWEEANRRVRDRILSRPGVRSRICSDCLWNSLCQQQDVENSVENV